MASLTMDRRSFVKLAAATTAAVGLTSIANEHALADNPSVKDSATDIKRIRTCCRGCGKMECGVWVTVENGRAVKVEGDTSAFQSGGNCCTKSQSSIQAAYHPDRILYPLKRTNPKDADDPGWVRISWDEALSTMAKKYQELIDKYGGPTIMMMSGTSRCWCMGSYGVFRILFGSPNSVHPYQVCKGPRHFATLMNSAYAFSWVASVDMPKVFVRWGGSTELSNYDDSCRMTVDAAKFADQFITVDPRLTNLGKESTIWQNLYPQTDAALALSWTNVIIENKLYDEKFVKKWTDAPFLVVEDMEATPGPMGAKFQMGFFQTQTRLLKESDLQEGGKPSRMMCWDTIGNRLTYFDTETQEWEGETWTMKMKGKEAQQEHLFPGVAQGFVPDQSGFTVDDGFAVEIDPALYGTYDVTLKDGSSHKATTVWELYKARCEEYAPEKAAEITGIPADQIENAAKVYATRIDPETGYGNGGIGYMLAIEHGCNAIQNSRALDTLVGITGNWDTPGGNRGGTTSFLSAQQVNFGGNVVMDSTFSTSGMDEKTLEMLAGGDRFPLLKNWWQYWADANSCYEQMQTGDPYPIKGGIAQSGDFMNMGNATYNWESFKNLEFFVVSDFWHTPLSDRADIIVPCCHWLEVNATRPSQGSSGALGLNVQCVERPGETMYDLDFDIALYKAMGKTFNYDDPSNPWPTEEEYLDWYVSPTGMTWQEFAKEFQEHGWWDCKAMPESWHSTWGFYRRYELGMLRPDRKPGMQTPTGKLEIWSTVMETFFPDKEDILPRYVAAPLSREVAPEMEEEYPLILNTGRRIPVYFHSEHRQLPWCRELWPVPRLEIHPDDAKKYGIEQGDWVWVETENGKIRQCADIYPGIEPGVINAEHQWWYPELDQSGHGFELSNVNNLVSRNLQDRHCGASYLRAYPCKIYKATADNSPFGNPIPCGNDGTPIIHDSSDPRLKEWAKLVYPEGDK